MKRVKKDRHPKPRNQFRERRDGMEVTQKKLANDLDVTELTIRNVEKGKQDPSSFMCFVYAAYLGVSVYELFPDMAEDARLFVRNLQLQH